MKKIWIPIIVAIIIIIAVAILYKPSPKETIKIGAILPLTGNVASYGESSKVALDLAMEEINKRGGIKGRKIEIIYEDSQGQPQTGVTAINKLITMDGIKVIIGPVMSSVTLAVAPIAEANKIILISVSSSPDITNAGDYIFRNRETAIQQSKKLADFIFNKLDVKEIVALYMNDDTGKGHFTTFAEEFKKMGGEILLSEIYDPGSIDFKTNLTKIKAKNPKVVYLASKPKDVGLILKQAKELGLDTQFVSSSGAEGKDVIDMAGDAANGLIYAYPSGNPNDSRVADFYKKYQERYKGGYEGFAALSYDSLKIIAIAMEECKNPIDTTCLKEKLYQVKGYYGASGETSFDEYGDAAKTIILKTVKNGQFVPYEE